MQNIYERDEWSKIKVMHPGGLDLTNSLIKLSGLENGRIMDIGCGCGTTVAYLRETGFDAVGVDLSDSLIARGLELYPDIPLYAADAESLPFSDEEFDASLMACSLSLMDIERALKECRRLVRRNGFLLISDLYCNDDSDGSSGKTLVGWRDAIEKQGFTLTHIENCSCVLSDFIAQILWDNGSLGVVAGCDKWMKSTIPGYFIASARKN